MLNIPINTQGKESPPVQRNVLQNGLGKEQGNQLDNDKSISERRTERRTEREIQITGTSSSVFDTGGTRTITLDLSYTWNDVIDPNPQYTTDNIKSLFAERITLGRAEPYTIHVTWSSQSIVEIDASGNVVSSEGWPFN